MTTRTQTNKIERLANEIHSLWLDINESNDAYSIKELEKMQIKLNNKEEELNRYCIKIGITENELFSIEIVANILDGVCYNEYINNY